MTAKTVLIVDDEADLLESLADFFEGEGYRVKTATDGRQALALLGGKDLPCIVILDLLMPERSGIEVYAAMQADPALAKVAVIVSTSDPSRAPSGALVMKKPVDVERMLNAVREIC